MTALGALPPQPWMTAPETKLVLAALTADGAEVRFVGGCVRDALAGRPVMDIDLATPDPPEMVLALLERARIRAIPTGIAHGTVTAVAGEQAFEITTLRRDVACDGRHAVVAFTAGWRADAARRDFTINALSATPDGAVHDYFNGLRDLSRGHIRFVGLAWQRVEEDLLRILRYFRFYAHYGRPPADSDALAACRKLAPRLPELSAERVRAELLRILAAPDPAGVLLLMQGERVLEYVLPEAKEFGRLRLLAFIESRGIKLDGIAPDPLRRLASVLAPGVDVAALAARLRLSNRESERLAGMSDAPPPLAPRPDMDPHAVRLALHRLGAERFRDLALIAWAGRRASPNRGVAAETARWLALLEAARDWRPIRLPVGGADVLAVGVPPGPAVGRLLAEVERWWEDGDFSADREAALAEVRRLAAKPIVTDL